MLPTYAAGDMLLVARGIRPRAGAVAVVRLPPDALGRPRPLAIKRLTGTDPDEPTSWWFESDNPAEGVTAFETGALASDDVLAIALCRLSPRWGRLRGTDTPSS